MLQNSKNTPPSCVSTQSFIFSIRINKPTRKDSLFEKFNDISQTIKPCVQLSKQTRNLKIADTIVYNLIPNLNLFTFLPTTLISLSYHGNWRS